MLLECGFYISFYLYSWNSMFESVSALPVWSDISSTMQQYVHYIMLHIYKIETTET